MKKIVVLGMMSRHPVAGVVWQTLHYLLGFERLGFETYYVEAAGHQPSAMLGGDGDPYRSQDAARFIDGALRPFGLGDRWAFHALHHDGQCYGLSERRLLDLYDSAELILNLHGATIPLPEHSRSGCLVFLETDPVALQIELLQDSPETIAYLEPHVAFFTFGENLGRPGCLVPNPSRFHFRPTRQPVVCDLWETESEVGPAFTTLGNWAQGWRDVEFDGTVYHWSKHHEFLKFLDLPRRATGPFELALSSCDEHAREMLSGHGWIVRDGLEISATLHGYREYIQGSRGEFTVAKDQNVRLRSGWFSDRSATYLAAGRPVITQDTGFGDILPLGRGLFAFQTLDDIVEAVEAINAEPEQQARDAGELGRAYFGHDVVLEPILESVGLVPQSGARREVVAR